MIFLIDDFPLPLFPIRRIFCFASLTFAVDGLLSPFSLTLELALLVIVAVLYGLVGEVSMENRLEDVSVVVVAVIASQASNAWADDLRLSNRNSLLHCASWT